MSKIKQMWFWSKGGPEHGTRLRLIHHPRGEAHLIVFDKVNPARPVAEFLLDPEEFARAWREVMGSDL